MNRPALINLGIFISRALDGIGLSITPLNYSIHLRIRYFTDSSIVTIKYLSFFDKARSRLGITRALD